jgi:Sigma-70 region 2
VALERCRLTSLILATRCRAKVYEVGHCAMHTRAVADDKTSPFAPTVAPNLGGTLYRHAMRLTNNRADAEDLRQDAIANLLASGVSFSGRNPTPRARYGVMVNAYITNSNPLSNKDS